MVVAIDLLKSFLGSFVLVTTKLTLITEDELGNTFSTNETVDGYLMGLDDKFIYIGDNKEAYTMLALDSIGYIQKTTIDEEEPMGVLN